MEGAADLRASPSQRLMVRMVLSDDPVEEQMRELAAEEERQKKLERKLEHGAVRRRHRRARSASDCIASVAHAFLAKIQLQTGKGKLVATGLAAAGLCTIIKYGAAKLLLRFCR